MNKEEVLAMAVAVVAEELNLEVHKVKIISFHEVGIDAQEDQK